MPGRFNLARRPFVDTRPANLTAMFLALIVASLSFVAARTVTRYFADSSRTRASIAGLKDEIANLEEARQRAQASLAHIDVAALAGDVGDANEIALRRAFSWTRFLTRLERTLPPDIRIASIGLQKMTAGQGAPPVAHKGSGESVIVSLGLVSRDQNGLPKTIRAFDASPWFDGVTPVSEDRAEKGLPEGLHLALTVAYHDVEPTKDVRP